MFAILNRLIDEHNQMMTAMGGALVDGRFDYNGLANKPKINNVEIVGDLMQADLGISVDVTVVQELNSFRQRISDAEGSLNTVHQALADEYLKREEAQETYAASDTLDALRDDFDTAMNDTERGVYATFQNLETRLQGKADVEDVYSKSDVDTKLLAKPDKTVVDTQLSSKADASDVTTLRNQMSSKANVSDVYTKAEVYTKSEVSATVSTLALKSEVPDVTVYAKKTDVPSLVDLSDYAKKSDVSGLVDLSTYAKKSTVDALTTQMDNKLDKADASEVLGMENYALYSDLRTLSSKVDEKASLTEVQQKYLRVADVDTRLATNGFIKGSVVDDRITASLSRQHSDDETVFLRLSDLKGKLEDESVVFTTDTTVFARITDIDNNFIKKANINTDLASFVKKEDLATEISARGFYTSSQIDTLLSVKKDKDTETLAPDDSEPGN